MTKRPPGEVLLRSRAQICLLPALTGVPHHSAAWPTTLSPHATPPSRPRPWGITGRRRSPEEPPEPEREYQESTSVASKITAKRNTTKSQKHDSINGRPLNAWRRSGEEVRKALQVVQLHPAVSSNAMTLVAMRIINRNGGGDYREPRPLLVITPFGGSNCGRRGNRNANTATCAPWCVCRGRTTAQQVKAAVCR